MYVCIMCHTQINWPGKPDEKRRNESLESNSAYSKSENA